MQRCSHWCQVDAVRLLWRLLTQRLPVLRVPVAATRQLNGAFRWIRLQWYGICDDRNGLRLKRKIKNNHYFECRIKMLCLHQKLFPACDFWYSPLTCTTWGLFLYNSLKKKKKDTFIGVFCATSLFLTSLLRSISLQPTWGLWIWIEESFSPTKILEIDCSISLWLSNVELCRADVDLLLTAPFSLSG